MVLSFIPELKTWSSGARDKWSIGVLEYSTTPILH